MLRVFGEVVSGLSLKQICLPWARRSLVPTVRVSIELDTDYGSQAAQIVRQRKSCHSRSSRSHSGC